MTALDLAGLSLDQKFRTLWDAWTWSCTSLLHESNSHFEIAK